MERAQILLRGVVGRRLTYQTTSRQEGVLQLMGIRKKSEPDDPERSARFIEIAEQIQAEDAEERFEEAMKCILRTRKTPSETEPDKKQ